MSKRAVTVEEMRDAVIQVYNECNGNLPMKFVVRETAEEIYGTENVKKYPQLKLAQGAYLCRGDHNGRNKEHSFVYLQSSAILYNDGTTREHGEGTRRNRANEKALKVVRHEVLGHYGLNTCSPAEKMDILKNIVDNRQSSEVLKLWKDVDRDYIHIKDKPLRLAEEVFSFVAERKPVLDKSFDFSSEPFGLEHVEQTAAKIAEGIRLGERIQQTFPQSNSAQFSNVELEKIPSSNSENVTYSTHYQWSKEELKMVITINDQQPNNIPSNTLSKIITTDKFLQNYSLEMVQDGKLDLSLACGSPAIPKQYDSSGKMVVVEKEAQQARLTTYSCS